MMHNVMMMMINMVTTMIVSMMPIMTRTRTISMMMFMVRRMKRMMMTKTVKKISLRNSGSYLAQRLLILMPMMNQAC